VSFGDGAAKWFPFEKVPPSNGGYQDFSSGRSPAPESDDPTALPLFLDVDDDVSLTQIFTQASILAAQLLIFFF